MRDDKILSVELSDLGVKIDVQATGRQSKPLPNSLCPKVSIFHTKIKMQLLVLCFLACVAMISAFAPLTSSKITPS